MIIKKVVNNNLIIFRITKEKLDLYQNEIVYCCKIDKKWVVYQIESECWDNDFAIQRLKISKIFETIDDVEKKMGEYLMAREL